MGIVQEIEIWPYERMVNAQNRIRLGEWDTENSSGYWDPNQSPKPGQEIRLCNDLKRQKNCGLFYSVIPADHRVKLKVNEKKDKSLDLVKKLKSFL